MGRKGKTKFIKHMQCKDRTGQWPIDAMGLTNNVYELV